MPVATRVGWMRASVRYPQDDPERADAVLLTGVYIPDPKLQGRTDYATRMTSWQPVSMMTEAHGLPSLAHKPLEPLTEDGATIGSQPSPNRESTG